MLKKLFKIAMSLALLGLIVVLLLFPSSQASAKHHHSRSRHVGMAQVYHYRSKQAAHTYHANHASSRSGRTSHVTRRYSVRTVKHPTHRRTPARRSKPRKTRAATKHRGTKHKSKTKAKSKSKSKSKSHKAASHHHKSNKHRASSTKKRQKTISSQKKKKNKSKDTEKHHNVGIFAGILAGTLIGGGLGLLARKSKKSSNKKKKLPKTGSKSDAGVVAAGGGLIGSGVFSGVKSLGIGLGSKLLGAVGLGLYVGEKLSPTIHSDPGTLSIHQMKASRQAKKKVKSVKTPDSPGKLQKEVERGKAPKDVNRVDKPHIPGQKPHVHFKDGTSLNEDGTIHDKKNGEPSLSNKTVKWLEKHNWRINKK